MPIQTLRTQRIQTTLGNQTRTYSVPYMIAPHLQKKGWDIFGTDQRRFQDRLTTILGHDVETLNAFIQTLNASLSTLASVTLAQRSQHPAAKDAEGALKQLSALVKQWDAVMSAYQTIANAKGYHNADDRAFYLALSQYQSRLHTRRIDAHIDYALLVLSALTDTKNTSVHIATLQDLIRQHPNISEQLALQTRVTGLLMILYNRQRLMQQMLTTQLIEKKHVIQDGFHEEERKWQRHFDEYRDNITQLKQENAQLKGRLQQVKRRFEDFVNGHDGGFAPQHLCIAGELIRPQHQVVLHPDLLRQHLRDFAPKEYRAKGLLKQNDASFGNPVVHQLTYISNLEHAVVRLKIQLLKTQERVREQECQAHHQVERYRHNINQLKRENAWIKGRLLQTQQRFEDFINGVSPNANTPTYRDRTYINGQMMFPMSDKPAMLDTVWPFKPKDYRAKGLLTDIPDEIKTEKPIERRLKDLTS